MHTLLLSLLCADTCRIIAHLRRNILLSTYVLQGHMKVGGKEMGPSVQPAKEQPPCIEVRKGIVENDVLSMHVLQTHLKVGGKKMGPSVQPAKEQPSCTEVCKGIVKNDVL